MRPLQAALRSDLALAKLEVQLIERARELYRHGFSRLVPSQMAACGERIERAGSRQDAEAEVRKWINGQLEKLREEEKRKGTRRSWLLRPLKEGAADSLGEALLAWIAGDAFLGEALPPDLDGLQALRRFWARLHGFYRYEQAAGEEMKLAALDLRIERGESR